MLIMDRINKKDTFTPTEVEIAEYLLREKQNLSEITVYDLASATYSSKASIVRFCQKLGFKGFRDFRVAFAKELESSKYIENSQVDYTHPFQKADRTDIIVNNMYNLYKKSLDQVQANLDYNQLEQISERMLQAKRIFLYGYGDVKLTLEKFCNMLLKINIFPIIATGNSEEIYISRCADREDCALFVTYSCRNKNFDKCAEILKKNKVSMIVITANQECELAVKSKNHIFVPDVEHSDKISTFYSQHIFGYLLNLIYALIYQNLKE